MSREVSRISWFPLALIAAGLSVSACSGPARNPPITVSAGDKVTVGPLTYSVIDTQIFTQLGENADSARIPQNRFYVVRVSVSNSGNADAPVPGLTLVDDSGNPYPEAADGSNVADWLGVVRSVMPAQTLVGTVLFDAPARHYRLRLSEDGDERDVFVDLPLDFVHEEVRDTGDPAEAPPQDSGATKK